MSTLNVNTINAATSGQGVAVDIQNPRTFRNIIINGAMQVAQRGTSSTSGDGYNTVDRIKLAATGPDENPTQTQHALTSSDTGPWEKGFRYSYHLQNGNQTGGADAADLSAMVYKVEAQDIAQSGWDYTSTSKDLTMSFWVKSSVAQAFYVQFIAHDVSGAYSYTFSTGSLTANTWTKVTHSIPGHANLVFNNDNGQGFEIMFYAYAGTNNTDSGHTLNTWAAYAGGSQAPDMTSTWYTTNDSTLEWTGIQLEVGSYATDFEHRSYAEELHRCQRYYQLNQPSVGYTNSTTVCRMTLTGPVEMRTSPTIAIANGTNGVENYVVAGRNVTALGSTSLSSGTNLGGLVDATVATTTANKPHAIFGKVISMSAEL